MEVWVWSSLIINIVLFALLVMQIRDRRAAEDALERLEEEHYEVRKQAGLLTASERIHEAAMTLSNAVTNALIKR